MAIKKNKKQFVIIAALVLLFATRWMYCRLQYKGSGGGNTIVFMAQSIFFVLFYALSVMHASTPLLFGFACAGAAVLAALQWFMGGAFSALAVLAFLPALIFLTNQIPAAQSKATVEKITTVLLYAFPLVLAVLFAVSIAVNGWNIGVNLLYYPVALIAVAVLYRVVFAAGKVKKHKAKNATGAYAATALVIVNFFTIVLGGVFLVNEGQLLLTHAVLALWVVNLFVLQVNAHPGVCAFSNKLKLKAQTLK